MFTIRSPFCGYNVIYCVEFNGEDLSRYLSKTESGDAENARHEIAGHENAAPECKSGKCET